MSDEDIHAVDGSGELLYSCANPAIHLFRRHFVETITSGMDVTLPFHRAEKKIPLYRKGGVKEIKGYKFEKFVFDSLSLTERNVILEIIREEEFAPVKNADGVDSVETARELMIKLHKKWLARKGISLPEITRFVEISPLVAVEPDDLDPAIIIPDQDTVLLER